MRRARQAPRAFAEPLEERIALAVFTVTNTNDTGAGSLRQAVLNANSTALAADTIVFDAAVFSTPRVIDVINPLPQFSSAAPLAIIGPGSALLTVRKTESGAAVYRRVFDSFAPTLTLSGMTLTGGNLTGANGAGLSCASGSNVTLDDMVITGNTANTNDGGGIYLGNNATLTIRNSVLTNNSARRGGGVYFFDGGSLVMDNCTVSGNTAVGTSGRDVSGGGVYFGGAALPNPPAGFLPATLLIRNSTISNNTAAGGGGGFGSENLTGTLLVRNSTVSGNTAATSGGGILQTASAVTITIEDSTITNNSAGGTVTGTNATGGGGICRVTSYPGTLNITNSIVSGNSNPLTPDILTTNTTTNVQYSAIGSASGFTLSASSNHNVPFGTNLLLGRLDYNGGPTRTHAPLPGSPLINAGSNALVPAGMTTDQRGPGFPRVVGPAVDVGAYESQTVSGPRVTQVFVNGPGMGTNAAFRTAAGYAAPFGYPVPGGTAQLRSIPWVGGVNQVAVRFDQDVAGQIAQADLVVRGSSSTYALGAFTYDAATRTALWTLNGPAVTQDKLRLFLDDAGLPGLDGEWVNGEGTYPSGNGAAGGDFSFRVNVLAGDSTGDGVVNALDMADVKRRLARRPGDGVTGAGGYSVFADLTSDGVVNALDLAAARQRLGRRLPAPEPAAFLP